MYTHLGSSFFPQHKGDPESRLRAGRVRGVVAVPAHTGGVPQVLNRRMHILVLRSLQSIEGWGGGNRQGGGVEMIPAQNF